MDIEFYAVTHPKDIPNYWKEKQKNSSMLTGKTMCQHASCQRWNFQLSLASVETI